jgi:hypothetical protein
MNSTTKVLLSSSPDNLRAALAAYKSAGTVEAEYGDVLVEGHFDPDDPVDRTDDQHTLAHHGSRSTNPPPCLAKNRNLETYGAFGAIGLSHVDLDALGGVLAFMGRRPHDVEVEKFWRLAAWVDINGPHRLDEYSAGAAAREMLFAFWAWSEKNKQYAPRDGSVLDITEYVEKAETALHAILGGDKAMLEAGRAFEAREDALNRSSFVLESGGVIVRSSESFCNHLYATPNGKAALAVVSHNPKTMAVTISLAGPIEGVNCRDIAVDLWGPEAGGHAGIAGGPRTGLDPEEAARAASVMRAAILGCRKT